MEKYNKYNKKRKNGSIRINKKIKKRFRKKIPTYKNIKIYASRIKHKAFILFSLFILMIIIKV